MDTDTRQSHAEQFAEEWLLVAMNDYDTYTDLMEKASRLELVALSDELRDEWERLAEQVKELTEEHISPIAGLFIAQILQGQGSLPFDLIAKQVKHLESFKVEIPKEQMSQEEGW